MKLEFDGFDELLGGLSMLRQDVPKIAEDALRETHRIVTQNIEQAFTPSNMPAKGRYWSGKTLEKLRREANVEWNGDVASVPVGFEIKGAGINSIFLMYGTPRHKPPMKKARGLYEAVYGKSTVKAVQEAQEFIFRKAFEEAMNG